MGNAQPVEPIPLTPAQLAKADRLFRQIEALQNSGVTMMILSAPKDGNMRVRPVGHAIDIDALAGER